MEEKMEQDSGKVWVQLNLAPAADGCLTAMLQVRAAAHAISADASGAGTTAKGKPKFKVGDRVQSRLANGQVWRWYLGTITSYHGYFNQAVGIDCDFKHVYAIMFDHGESEEYVIEALIRHPRAVAARSPPAMSFAAAAAGAAAAASCTDAAASSSAPSHPSGAGPNGATKSTERAAADMAVRTKPPPGWRTAPAADVAAPRLSARQARAPARLDPAEEQERSRQRASGSAVGKRRADEYAVQRIIEEQMRPSKNDPSRLYPWFRIRWANFGPEADTWERLYRVPPKLVAHFRLRQADMRAKLDAAAAAEQARMIRVAPPPLVTLRLEPQELQEPGLVPSSSMVRLNALEHLHSSVPVHNDAQPSSTPLVSTQPPAPPLASSQPLLTPLSNHMQGSLILEGGADAALDAAELLTLNNGHDAWRFGAAAREVIQGRPSTASASTSSGDATSLWRRHLCLLSSLRASSNVIASLSTA